MPDDAAWQAPWADLPLDLLRLISRRLHAATDYVRFHAACKPWREALPPPPRRPAFLPWLLGPPDSTTSRRRARCVFSSRSSRRGAAEMWVPDRRWVVSLDDGTAASTLTTAACRPGSSASGGDPLTGSAGATPLPALPSEDETKWWADHAVGTVSGDGTVCLYVFGPIYGSYHLPDLNAALLRPGGDAAWAVVRDDLSGRAVRCRAAYSGGKIAACDGRSSWCVTTGQVEDLTYRYRWCSMPYEDGKELQSSYLVESGDEILWAAVLVDRGHFNTYCCYHHVGYHRVELGPDFHSLGSFLKGLVVSVYALEVEKDGGKARWVRRDSKSFADRVMFLGHPTSFAVDAARFGASGSGCAYFVVKSQVYGGIWSKSALERCRVFRYNFHDGKSELVEQLPDGWSDDEDRCMWLTPQPSMASTEEIRERLEPSHTKAAEPEFGPYFRIYVGNLPRKVDSCQLRQFFSKHGKVADARVMCHIKTKRSRGFGFVTMATAVDDEPSHAIAKLDRQILDGRPVRVKFADQRQPSN